MRNEVFVSKDGTFRWLDIADPEIEDLMFLQTNFGIHGSSFQDLLDPNHLPKYEDMKSYVFIIIRYFDNTSAEESGTVHELTNKINIFINENTLITVHRHKATFLSHIQHKWLKDQDNTENLSLPILLAKIFKSALLTYSMPITDSQRKIEFFEDAIFNQDDTFKAIQQKYLIRRQMYVYEHVLKLCENIIDNLSIIKNQDPSVFQDLKETAHTLHFETASIFDNVNSLINLYLAFSSHKTSYIIRILTLFSVVLLPLTLITGIFGMNFIYIPGEKDTAGFFIVIFIMVLIAICMYLWFHRKGWLGK